MNLYKVTFENNHAVAGERLYVPSYTDPRIETTGHHVKWITVYADDEIESLHIANNAVKDYAQQLKVA